MSEIFACITDTEITVHDRGQVVTFLLPIEKDLYKTRKPVVLLANVKDVTTRVAVMPAKEKMKFWQQEITFSTQRKREDLWELIKTHFPISEKMNTTTHMFDGADFDGCILLTAIPISIAENIAENCARLFGGKHKLKRLDTMQHHLLKRHSAECLESTWIIFPEGQGFCIMHVENCTPKAVWHISNHPDFREEELLRYIKTAPKRAVVYGEENEWMDDMFASAGIEIEEIIMTNQSHE